MIDLARLYAMGRRLVAPKFQSMIKAIFMRGLAGDSTEELVWKQGELVELLEQMDGLHRRTSTCWRRVFPG